MEGIEEWNEVKTKAALNKLVELTLKVEPELIGNLTIGEATQLLMNELIMDEMEEDIK